MHCVLRGHAVHRVPDDGDVKETTMEDFEYKALLAALIGAVIGSLLGLLLIHLLRY